MKSYHGSSVIRTFFRIGISYHKLHLAHTMKGKVVELSMHPFAYRVVTTVRKNEPSAVSILTRMVPDGIFEVKPHKVANCFGSKEMLSRLGNGGSPLEY